MTPDTIREAKISKEQKQRLREAIETLSQLRKQLATISKGFKVKRYSGSVQWSDAVRRLAEKLPERRGRDLAPRKSWSSWRFRDRA
jgi:ribosomal protein L19E